MIQGEERTKYGTDLMRIKQLFGLVCSLISLNTAFPSQGECIYFLLQWGPSSTRSYHHVCKHQLIKQEVEVCTHWFCVAPLPTNSPSRSDPSNSLLIKC